MKTIKGYTDDFAYGPAGLIAISKERYSEDDRPAILCISEDGTPPKVMAVEEVEKMVREIIEKGERTMPLSRVVKLVASKYNLNP